MTHKPSAPAAVAPATSPSAGRAVPTAEATQAPPQAAGEASAAYEALIRADEREAILRLLPGGQTCDPQEIADMIRARGDAASCLLAEVKRLQGEVQHWREARHTAMLAGELLQEEVKRLRTLLDQIAAYHDEMADDWGRWSDGDAPEQAVRRAEADHHRMLARIARGQP